MIKITAEKQTILVTGGAGFIGASLVHSLLKTKPDTFIIIVDNLITGTVSNLPSYDYSRWEFIKADVNDPHTVELIFNKYQPDIVFHCAALTGVERTLANPLMVLQDIKGIENLVKQSVKHKVKRFFFTSSSEVYGEPFILPLKEEETPINAKLPYAAVKAFGEVIIKTYGETHQLPYTIFRLFNTYGPLQRPDFVISKFLKAALENKPITVHGDGKQTRTFCYIDDTIEVFLKAMESNDTLYTTMNVGNDQEISILELARLIKKLTKSTSPIVHVPARKKGEVSRRKPDNSKMKKLLGRELTPLPEGIKKIIQAWTSK